MENNEIEQWFFEEIIDYNANKEEDLENLSTTKGLLHEMQKIFLKNN
jgi:hypothetical protein